MNPGVYVTEIRSIEKEEKRLRARQKKLREQKKKAQAHLYTYLDTRGIEKCGGITKKSVQPREKKVRKKTKDRKKDALELFRTTGIPDPEKFWNDFQNTQKKAQIEGHVGCQ